MIQFGSPAITPPMWAAGAAVWMAVIVTAMTLRLDQTDAPTPGAAAPVMPVEYTVAAAPPDLEFTERWADLRGMLPPVEVIEALPVIPIKTVKVAKVPVEAKIEAKAEASKHSMRDGICERGKIWYEKNRRRLWRCRR